MLNLWRNRRFSTYFSKKYNETREKIEKSVRRYIEKIKRMGKEEVTEKITIWLRENKSKNSRKLKKIARM